jgi:hypothetical protein
MHITKWFPEVDTHILQKYAGSTKILTNNRVLPAPHMDKPSGNEGSAHAHVAAASSDAVVESVPAKESTKSTGACEMLSTDIFGELAWPTSRPVSVVSLLYLFLPSMVSI